MIVPFKGEKDVCDEVPKIAKEKKAGELFTKYKIPQNCPFKPVSITGAFQISACFDVVSSLRLLINACAGTISDTIVLARMHT
jgi:hypothetical protein